MATTNKKVPARGKGSTPGESKAVVKVVDRHGLTEDDYKWIVGAGITLVISGQTLAISCDDIGALAGEGAFKFSLDGPVEFPTVKECYNDLRKTPPFDTMGLPEIPWETPPFDVIGGLQATIDTFAIDTGAGTFSLAISFKYSLKLLFLEFTEANFSVKRVVREPELTV